MIINRESADVGKMEVVNGKLIETKRVTCQFVTMYSYYECEDEEYLDHLINDFEEMLFNLKELRYEKSNLANDKAVRTKKISD